MGATTTLILSISHSKHNNNVITNSIAIGAECNINANYKLSEKKTTNIIVRLYRRFRKGKTIKRDEITGKINKMIAKLMLIQPVLRSFSRWSYTNICDIAVLGRTNKICAGSVLTARDRNERRFHVITQKIHINHTRPLLKSKAKSYCNNILKEKKNTAINFTKKHMRAEDDKPNDTDPMSSSRSSSLFFSLCFHREKKQNYYCCRFSGHSIHFIILSNTQTPK